MLSAFLSQVNERLATLRADGPRRVGRPAAVREFRNFAQSLAVDTAAEIAAWQEETLHAQPRLESAISWQHIDPVILQAALEQGDLSAAVTTLRFWTPLLASAVLSAPISEREMAIVATATQSVRDLADLLEAGASDDPDVGPWRVELPAVLFAVAAGAVVQPHPSVYVDLVAACCEVCCLDTLPDPASHWGDVPDIEATVVEGIRPAVAVVLWLGRRNRLRRLRAAVNYRLATRRAEADSYLSNLTEMLAAADVSGKKK